MKKTPAINPKYASNELSSDRFDDAIENAIQSNKEMQFEYERVSAKLQIAEMLRKLRIESDITQAELAEKIDVPQSFISRLENPEADKEPSINTLSKIAHAFGYKVVVGLEKESKSLGDHNDDLYAHSLS